MKLILARHGETKENRQKTLLGQLGGNLTHKGKDQALQLKNGLANEKIDLIVSSDLKRCTDTVGIVNKDMRVPVLLEPRLREINFGDLQGLPHRENNSKVDYLSNLNIKFPNGESNKQMINRVINAVNDIYNRYPNSCVLIVSHSGPLSVITACLNKVSLKETINVKARFATALTYKINEPLEYMV